MKRVIPVILDGLVFLNLSIALAYFVANYFTGEGINQAVYYQILYGFAGVNLSMFVPIISVGILALLFIIFISFQAHKIFAGRRGQSRLSAIAISVLAILLFANPATPQIYRVIRVNNSSKVEDVYALPDGRSLDYRQRFVAPAIGEAPHPKNFVYIYAESLERTFFDEKLFPGLMPDLGRLATHATNFSNIQSTTGATWTMGGVVASECGIPLTAGDNQGNLMGMVDKFLPNARCLGDSLGDAGYALHFYQGAELSFAGKGKFFRTHGFSVVKGRLELTKKGEPTSGWGRYDEATFASAINDYRSLLAGDRPFGLVALTLDTHPPHGFNSPTCKDRPYRDGSNELLNAVFCSQRQIARFIEDIFAQPGSQNTVVVLGSDHLMMNSDATPILDKGNRRDTLLVWDGGLDHPGRTIPVPGSTLDVSATLLPMLGFDAAQRFGLGVNLLNSDNSSLVAQVGGVEDVNQVLDSWQPIFKQAWFAANALQDGLRVADGSVQLGKRSLQLPVLIRRSDNGRVDDVFFDQLVDRFAGDVNAGRKSILLAPCGDFIGPLTGAFTNTDGTCAVWNEGDGGVRERALKPGEVFTPLPAGSDRELSLMRGSLFSSKLNAVVERGTIPQFSLQRKLMPVHKVVAVSSGLDAGRSYVVDASGERHPVSDRGFNVLRMRPGGDVDVLGAVDTCAPPAPGKSGLAPLIEQANAGDNHALIVAWDSAWCGNALDWAVKGTPLKKAIDVRMREPYVAFWSNDGVEEYRGNRYFPLRIEIELPPVAATDDAS